MSAQWTRTHLLQQPYASAELGRKLGLRIVAECVDTQAMCELLRKLGIDRLQSFLFGKPMPVEQLAA